MKVLVLGSKGQLGTTLKQAISETTPFQYIGLDRDQFNICDSIDLNKKIISQIKPQVIINSAAYTQVDKAETDPENAMMINGDSLKSLSLIANDLNAEVIHISTDFVFNGEKNTPYVESDVCDPLSVYGKSKLRGEELLTQHCKNFSIFRTSWLYSTSHPCFLTTMLRLAQERTSLGIVYDQTGTPTSSLTLANALCSYLKNRETSTQEIYHLSNEGVCSWYDFALSIFELKQLKIKVTPLMSHEYPTPARRPHYSVLSKRKFSNNFDYSIPHWREALKEALKN